MTHHVTHRPRRLGRASGLAPNLVIALRVALAFAAIGLFSLRFPFPAAALVLTVVAISLDGLDGMLARRLGVASDAGAVLDITADRVVEHIFWIYFAVVHQVGAWVPIVIVTRSFAVDAVRSMALSRGKTAFGEKTMMRSAAAHFLVASRFMRSLYGFAKVAAFVLLGTVITVQRAEAGSVFAPSAALARALEQCTSVMVVATVAICLARGLPVLWEGRTYLFGQARAS